MGNCACAGRRKGEGVDEAEESGKKCGRKNAETTSKTSLELKLMEEKLSKKKNFF